MAKTQNQNTIFIVDSYIKDPSVREISQNLIEKLSVGQVFNKVSALRPLDDDDAKQIKSEFKDVSSKKRVVLLTDNTSGYDSFIMPSARDGRYDSFILKFLREMKKDCDISLVVASNQDIPKYALKNLERLGIPVAMAKPEYKAVSKSVKKALLK